LLYGEKEVLPIYGIDNKYGSETKAAIIRFQNDNGLEPTGIFGKKEFKAVDSAIQSAEKDETGVS
jgi:peptidoglycan hydrolase-like protein with peptidoglycan-binding domain